MGISGRHLTRGPVLKTSTEFCRVPLTAQSDDQEAPPARSVSEPAGAALPPSLAEIYDTHFDFVWRNVRRLGVPADSADDATQDVFVVVQRRISDFDGRAPLRAWLFGILIRVASAHRRALRRAQTHCVPLEPELHQELMGAPQPMPMEQIERAQRAQLLEQLLDELDEDKRTVLILFELEEWTLREIAELCGSNVNTIYSRVRAAKRDFERAYLRSLSTKEGLP